MYYAILPTANETQRFENRPCSPARYVASDADADGFDGNCNIFSFGCLGPDNPPEDVCGDRQGFNREEGLVITVRHLVHIKREQDFCPISCFRQSTNGGEGRRRKWSCTGCNLILKGYLRVEG